MSTLGADVLSRLLTPGCLLVILGAVITFASKPLAKRFQSLKVTDVIIKSIGCGIALIGAVILFV